MEGSTGLVSMTTDQVPHARDLSFASVVPEDVAHPVFDEMSPLDVVWDKKVQHGFDSDGLLQQLAQWTGEQVSLMVSVMFEEMHQGGEDLIGKEKKPTAEFSHISAASLPVELYVDLGCLRYHSDVVQYEDLSSHPDTHHSQQSAYLVDEDSKSINQSFISNMLSQEKCSYFILDSGINEMDLMLVGMALEEANAAAYAEPAMFRYEMERKHDAGKLFCEMANEIVWGDIPSDIET